MPSVGVDRSGDPCVSPNRAGGAGTPKGSQRHSARLPLETGCCSPNRTRYRKAANIGRALCLVLSAPHGACRKCPGQWRGHPQSCTTTASWETLSSSHGGLPRPLTAAFSNHSHRRSGFYLQGLAYAHAATQQGSSVAGFLPAAPGWQCRCWAGTPLSGQFAS